MFKDFNIDNYEKKFLELGFEKTEEQHEYFCEYCDTEHYGDVFVKDGRKYYFDYDMKDVIEIDY